MSPSASPPNVPVTASLPSLSMITNVSPAAEANPTVASSVAPPRATVPVTASWSWPEPGVVPLSSTRKVTEEPHESEPVCRTPVLDPGETVPPVAVTAPTAPEPPRVVPADIVTSL